MLGARQQVHPTCLPWNECERPGKVDLPAFSCVSVYPLDRRQLPSLIQDGRVRSVGPKDWPERTLERRQPVALLVLAGRLGLHVDGDRTIRSRLQSRRGAADRIAVDWRGWRGLSGSRRGTVEGQSPLSPVQFATPGETKRPLPASGGQAEPPVVSTPSLDSLEDATWRCRREHASAPTRTSPSAIAVAQQRDVSAPGRSR